MRESNVALLGRGGGMASPGFKNGVMALTHFAGGELWPGGLTKNGRWKKTL